MFHLFQKWHSQSLPLYLNTGSQAACDKNAEFTWISLRPLGNETDADWKVGEKGGDDCEGCHR